MPYIVEFGPAVDAAIGRPAVQDELNAASTQIDEQFIRIRLVPRYPEMESQLGEAIQEFDDAERALSNQQSVLTRIPGGAAIAPWLSIALLLLFLATLFMKILNIAIADFLINEVFQVNYFNVWQAILLGVGLLTGIAWYEWTGWRRLIKDVLSTSSVNNTIPALTPIIRRIETVRSQIDDLIDKLVTQEILEIIGSSKSPFFQNVITLFVEGNIASPGLRATSADGLSEVTNKGHETPTQARREIMQLLQTLPGASIGLSGPRGAGKSTLLRSLTAANLKIRGKDAITVYTAAPVDYNGRDFLLHLFSSLCRQVLRTHDALDIADAPGASARGADSPWQGTMARNFRQLLILFGATAIMLSILVSPLLSMLDLKAGGLMLFGLMSLALGAALWAVNAPMVETLRSSFVRPFWPAMGNTRTPEERRHAPIVEQTRVHLSNIRFQRSFTSGWSGTIKIPTGFDLTQTSSAMLAERQESLPELVTRFSEYVQQVADEHNTVVIAIDELDKLKSAEDAEKFINELKSIFNIARCFYLVSVSEDALNSFERRGLALRDVFDSAFDDIRYMGYMDLDASRKMFLRRILNLPDPFVCLCYVLSGGLPRDLIRAARDMIEVAQSLEVDASLEEVAKIMIQDEATTKLRASISATKGIGIEPETGKFILAIYELQGTRVGNPDFSTKLNLLAAPLTIDSEPAGMQRLLAIRKELAAYLSFLDRTLDLANGMTTQTGWQAATNYGRVEELAQIRRSLEFNIGAASERLAKMTAGIGTA